ncbi:MAG: phosphatase PAP2 family protein [Acidobacteriaceae bacterium]|nr:phosphatase PAP2 family protein [Acidobacteriaceae bacterium]
MLLLVILLLCSLALAERSRYAQSISLIRDWIPMALTLVAFREMELFVPLVYNSGFERVWIRWDEIVLGNWGLKSLIESFGPLLTSYLELCYLLVYGVGSFCVLLLWVKAKRQSVDRFYVILLTGTLLAYGLFPFFPSRPPRIAFPGVGLPATHDVFRRLNLFLLKRATIHSSVFPSAHVSSAFSAAWAMFLLLPQQKRVGWGLLVFAFSVSVATIYGRYHYAADAVAGFAISLIAGLLCLLLRQK